MIDRHFHWRFVAYNGEPGAEKIHWGVQVEIIGYLSEADARLAAQDIVQREQYALTSVNECAACGFQRQIAGNMERMVEKV